MSRERTVAWVSGPAAAMLLVLTLVAPLIGCDRDAPSVRTRSSAPSPRPWSAPVSAPAAFDLAVIARGSTLVWASPHSKTLRRITLDPSGSISHTQTLYAPPKGAQVIEVAAVAGVRLFGVVWLERMARSARLLAIVNDGSPSAAASPGAGPLDLGPVELGDRAGVTSEPRRGDRVDPPRGSLAVALLNDDNILAFARADQEPCVDGSARHCFGFLLHRLSHQALKPRRVPLVVPRPCRSGAAQLAVAGERWFYGVCSDDAGGPTTTVFSIQFQPEYAQAEPVLVGCVPLGTIVHGGRVLLVGDCKGERRAVAFGQRERAARAVDLQDLRLDCVGDQAAFRAKGLDLVLKEPMQGLGVLLHGLLPGAAHDPSPGAASPDAAARMRAVWTGSALLVARVRQRTLTLTRHRCLGGRLEQVVIETQ